MGRAGAHMVMVSTHTQESWHYTQERTHTQESWHYPSTRVHTRAATRTQVRVFTVREQERLQAIRPSSESVALTPHRARSNNRRTCLPEVPSQ